jgi:asparagine synthetase B (glutamine-hydrolysing)
MVSVDDLVETAWSNAHPVDNSILLPALMCLAASRSGHRVLLEGASGDMAMHAPIYYPSVPLSRGEVWRAWRECQAASRNNVYLLGQSPLSIFMRSALLAGVPPALLHQVRRARYRKRPSPVDNSLINPEFAEKIRLRERLKEEFNMSQQAMFGDAQLAQVQTSLRLVCSGLSGYGRVASRFGVEVRDPWADPRVLDFFFRLPLGRKIRNGWTKYPVRTAFRHELAPEVRWRRDKAHLGWKFAHRLMAESHTMVSASMTQDLGMIGEYVNVKAVRALYDRFIKQGDDVSRDSVYELLTLIIWLRRIKGL